jgi:hypothetical protein
LTKGYIVVYNVTIRVKKEGNSLTRQVFFQTEGATTGNVMELENCFGVNFFIGDKIKILDKVYEITELRETKDCKEYIIKEE